jgi:hypothetical protein
MANRIRIIKHELFRSKCGSFEVCFADGRASRCFHSMMYRAGACGRTHSRGEGIRQGRTGQGDMSMKFASDRPHSDPGTAARKLLEIANIVKPVQERLLGGLVGALIRNSRICIMTPSKHVLSTYCKPDRALPSRR